MLQIRRASATAAKSAHNEESAYVKSNKRVKDADGYVWTAIARKPPKSAINGITTGELRDKWQRITGERLNYEKHLKQHAEGVLALRKLGVDVIVLDAEESLPDSKYMQDVAIVVKDVAILASFGQDGRRNEVGVVKEILTGIGLQTVELKGYDAILEGGNVVRSGNVMLVGMTYGREDIRTNSEGVKQLAHIVNDVAPEITVVGVPYTGVLHLGTGMERMTDNVALMSPMCTINLYDAYLPVKNGSGFMLPFREIYQLSRSEAYGANILAVNDGVVIPEGYPTVREYASRYYNKERIIEIDKSQDRIMDGSITCDFLMFKKLARE